MPKKLRVIFGKEADAKFISFNFLQKIFERSLRRLDLPLFFTEGFTKHMKMSFGPALPVGLAGTGEVFDVVLTEEISIPEFIEGMNRVLPDGLRIKKACYVEPSDKIANITGCFFKIKKTGEATDIPENWKIVSDNTDTFTIEIDLRNFKHKALFDKFGMENVVERRLILNTMEKPVSTASSGVEGSK